MKKQDKTKKKRKTTNKSKKKVSIFTKINNWFKKLERRIFNDKGDSSNSNFSLLEVIIIILILVFTIFLTYENETSLSSN